MPSDIHETFIRLVEYNILMQLAAIQGREDALGAFARRIVPTGSTTLQWKSPKVRSGTQELGKTIRHDPDMSYKHLDAQYPGVIIEVSYSQKQKDLLRLADDYILESDSSIKLVIGLDLEYRGTKRASILMWRPRIVINEQDGNEELVAEQVVNKVR